MSMIGNYNLTPEQFLTDLKKAFKNQYKKCKAYQVICKARGFSKGDIDSPEDIPYITSNTFKKSEKKFPSLILVPPTMIKVWTASSGTSGNPSIVGRNEADIEAYKSAYAGSLNHYYGFPRDVALVFFPTPQDIRSMISEKVLEKPIEPFFANCCEVMGNAKSYENKHFLLKPTPQNPRALAPDMELFIKLLKQAEAREQSVFIGGTVGPTYNVLVGYNKKTGDKFNLGDKSFVGVGAGGWDGKKGAAQGQPISKKDFVEQMGNILGIPVKNVFDGYGLTEHPSNFGGHYSPKFEDFVYHVPPWSKVILRDFDTLEPITAVGKKGLIEVVTAYGVESYAGVAILVDDIAEFVYKDKCPECGSTGDVIRILGRAKGAESKGCGALVGDMTS